MTAASGAVAARATRARATASNGAPTSPGWQAARRILAVRLDNFGDVLMTTPALRAVRESNAGMHVTLLASPAGAAVARLVPCVDDIMAFEAPWVKHAAADETDAPGGREAALVAELAARRFDAAIVFTVCTQSALPAALVCRMAGIPLRLAHSRENPYGLLTDWRPETDVVAEGMRHEVARQLALVASVGYTARDERLVLKHGADDAARARAALRSAGVDPDRPYLVFHIGATAASRRYAPEAYGQAAVQLIAAGAGPIVFSGDAGDAALIAHAIAAMGAAASQRAFSLAGQLDLGGLAALIAGARLVVANNTGPMHMAAATQTPVVALYALTNPQHTPWRVRSAVLNREVPCRHCLKSVCPEGHHACLVGVTPDEVAGAALGLMNDAAPAPGSGARMPAAVGVTQPWPAWEPQ